MSRFSFARAFDSFLYKRLKDGGLALDLYEASALGAVLSLAGSALVAVLVLSELLAYLSHGIRQEVFVAPASSDLLRLSFNITFPRLPCNQVDLEVENALGVHMHNVTRNIAKFKVDAATGRALLLVAHSSDPRYEEAEGDFSHRRDDSEGLIKQLTTATFAGYVRAHRLALVAYGAPWCPYSRRLAPVWDEIATVIGFSDDVRLGRVDCTEPEAEALCSAAHINAYPTILLYKDGNQHSDINYHGDRTKEAILSFLVIAQQDDSLVTGPEHSDEGHAHGEAIQRQLGLLPPVADGAAAGDKDHDHASGSWARDPAEPGKALRLIEAMHKAGLAAPGDAARAALAAARGLAGAAPTPTDDAAAAAKAGSGGAPPDEPGTCGEGAGAKGIEGCRVAGYLEVARVPGAFRVTASAEGRTLVPGSVNMSHIVHDLFVGPQLSAYQLSRLPAGLDAEMHALRGRRFVSENENATHAHYLNVVGSAFRFGTGHAVDGFRYTANSHAFVDETREIPEARWSFNLSPLTVLTVEERQPLYKFVTTVLAIVGGVLGIVSVADTALHASLRTLAKRRMGKQT